MNQNHGEEEQVNAEIEQRILCQKIIKEVTE